MNEYRPAKLSDISELEDGHGFTLLDPDDNALAVFVYQDEAQARQGARLMQAAIEKAMGVMLPGPF